MSARLFDTGRQALANKEIDWDTDAYKIVQLLLDGSLTDTAIKAITGVTNANPAVFTCTSHGFSQGDLVCVRGVLGNLSVNQLGIIAAASFAASTFSLVTVQDGLAIQGSGAYTSGGCVINLTLAGFLGDIDGARVGTDVALAGKTQTKGVLDANDVTFTGVTGTIHAHAIYQDSGAAGTSRLLHYMDGRIQVVVAKDVAATDTTVWVEPLEGPIASGVAMVMSNGVTLTTSAPAVEGARSISVTSAPGIVVAGHTAEVQATGSGLPITLTSADYTNTFSNGANKIAKI